MKLDEIDHWMTDLLSNVSGKLNQVGDINLCLGRKLEKLADISTRSERKIESVGEKLETLAVLSTRTEERVDRVADQIGRLADKIDNFADASASTNVNIGRLVEGLLKRRGKRL